MFECILIAGTISGRESYINSAASAAPVERLAASFTSGRHNVTYFTAASTPTIAGMDMHSVMPPKFDMMALVTETRAKLKSAGVSMFSGHELDRYIADMKGRRD